MSNNICLQQQKFNAIHNNNFITSNFHHHYQYITNSSALTSIHVHNNCPFHIRSPHASSPISYLFLSFQDDMILTGSSLRPDDPIKAFKKLQMDKDGSDFKWSYGAIKFHVRVETGVGGISLKPNLRELVRPPKYLQAVILISDGPAIN
ncbi:hypothetical protein YC2023_089466 [Brassica napus]